MGNLTALENTTQIELTSTIWKGREGWEGRTNTAEDGAGYQITTSKGRKGLRSYAQKGTFVNGSFTFMMFSDKSIELATTDAKCTENSVKALHEEALIKFLELTADEPEAYKIPIGQRLICYGYGMNEEAGDWIIYKINSSVSFNAVDVKNYKTRHFDHVRDIEEKFGIGTYYVENDKFNGTIEELNALVQQAKEQKQRKEAEEQAERETEKALRLKKIEEGKKLVSIPSSAVSVIVADLYAFNGDSMTDYYSTTILKTVVLGFSSSKNNNMNELKKYALNFEETATHPEEGEKFENKNESGSYGPTYYLGPNGWNGWKVNKRGKYDGYNLETEAGKEEVYISAVEGRYFVNENETPEPEKTNFEAVQVPEGEIQIIDYSEKAIAVIGDTKPIKDQLKQLGGKFNFRLSCGAGWIFSKKQLPELEKLLSGGNVEEEAKEEPEAKIYDGKRDENGAFNIPCTLQVFDSAGTELTNTFKKNETTLKDEIQKTVDFLAQVDVKIYGEVTDSVKECARVQDVEINSDLIDKKQAVEVSTTYTLFD